jgi:nucleoid-associated protein YgaU
MPSQTTLIWAGAAAAVVVVAGAGAAALVWTHPDLVWPGPDSAPIAVRAPERPPPAVLPPRSADQSSAQSAGQTASLAPASEAPAGNALAVPNVKPSFDVVTVDPTGEAVIAGRAAPNAKVELRDAGKTVGAATADGSGQFVIIPPTLAPGSHSLSLAADPGKGEPETSNVVAVSVPEPALTAPVAAVKPPTPVAAAPAPPAATMRTLATSPATDASHVGIRSVQADTEGGLVARGSAEPNSLVRLYLNGAAIADAKTKSDGLWSLTIKRGMAPGAYSVRAEEVNPAGATVVASAEIRFDYPSTPAPIGGPAAAAPPATQQSSEPSTADAVLNSIQTAPVVTGHTLWALSQNFYGDPTRYPLIYEANKAQIHNPNLIYPGQVFVVPKFEAKP